MVNDSHIMVKLKTDTQVFSKLSGTLDSEIQNIVFLGEPNWVIGSECEVFSVRNQVFHYSGSAYVQDTTTVMSGGVSLQIYFQKFDQTLDFGIGTLNTTSNTTLSLFKYNSGTTSYDVISIPSTSYYSRVVDLKRHTDNNAVDRLIFLS